MRLFSHFRVLASAAAAAVAGQALADVPASLGVDPGSTALLTLEIEVTGVDGTEVQSDSKVVQLGGDGAARFTPNDEPFDGMILDALVLRPGDCTLNYEFFCNPIFGCVSISVDLRNITATLQGPAGGVDRRRPGRVGGELAAAR